MIMFLRRLAYRLAYRRGWNRPRPGSPLYSPTLDYEYAFKDSEALDAFWDAVRIGYEVGIQQRRPEVEPD